MQIGYVGDGEDLGVFEETINMIEKAEIDKKSKEFEINPSDVARDYVFGWFLYGLFTKSKLKDELFLKGGNAIRKGYIETSRYSRDLDFGMRRDITENVLLDEINGICKYVEEKSGVVFRTEDNLIKEKFAEGRNKPLPNLHVYEIRVYFEDIYGKSEYRIKLSMDLTRYDRHILDIQTVPLIHPYSDSAEVVCDIRCMKLEEIIATKLKCLIQREHAPDLFDYVFCFKKMGVVISTDEVVKTFIKKTIFSRNPNIPKDTLLKYDYSHHDSLWDKAIRCINKEKILFQDALDFFKESVLNIFSTYDERNFSTVPYFSAEDRLKIMKAGREQTLLEIGYKGSIRQVEPYGLKYMQKKDGSEKEYLYAYNLTGSENPPGIRQFLPDRIESLSNTEIDFQPQFEVELCKAGEYPENKYLFDPNRPEPAPKKRREKSYSTLRYIYQCSYCGKKFPRQKQNNKIRRHKDKNGYDCHGTYGYYVDTKY